jgi:hypothetical protein
MMTPDTDFEARLRRVLDEGARQLPVRLVEWQPPGPAPAPKQAWLHHRRVIVGLVAALVAALLGVAIATRSSGPASAAPALPRPLPFVQGTHEVAVEFLTRAAAIQSSREREPGPVGFSRTQNYALDTAISRHKSTTVVETIVRDVWEAADGSALVQEYRQDTEPAGGDVGGPRPITGLDHGGRYRPGQWVDTNVGLPAEVASTRSALLNNVSNAASFSADILLADQVSSHLSTGTASPQQIAALYQVLAQLPGVFDAGVVVDNASRTGHAIGVVISDPAGGAVQATEYFVIDPNSGQPLQMERVDTPNPPSALRLPPGPTVEEYQVILATGQVDRVGVEVTR